MNNLYNFDSTIITSDPSPTYIEAGIRENLYLKEIKYETTENNNNFLGFYFENKQGDKLSHTEWPPRVDKPIEQLTDKEKEDFLKKVDNQKRRIGQIVKTYVTKEQFNVKAESFKDYAQEIIKLLKGKTEDVPVRVKVIYNDSNYTSLPKYWKYKFIEPMTVPTEESKIKILNIDKVERTTPNVRSNSSMLKEESPASQLFDSSTTEAEEDTDEYLPF